MTDKDFNKSLELTYVEKAYIPKDADAEIMMSEIGYNHFDEINGAFIATNEKAIDISQDLSAGESISVLELLNRDLKYHRCYFSLINYIYDYLPKKFKNSVSKKHFYNWLKHFKGDYDVIFEFKDGTKFIEYKSISFGRMSQREFEDYVRQQLPWIYSNVIEPFFDEHTYKGVIETIEEQYLRFLEKLNK